MGTPPRDSVFNYRAESLPFQHHLLGRELSGRRHVGGRLLQEAELHQALEDVASLDHQVSG